MMFICFNCEHIDHFMNFLNRIFDMIKAENKPKDQKDQNVHFSRFPVKDQF